MQIRDFGLLLLTCFLWATNTLVSKYVISVLNVPPLFYASARFALLSVLASPWLLPMPRPRWRVVAIALLLGAGGFALMFVGLKTANVAAAAVVSQIGVPMTIFLSALLLGEPLRWRRTLGSAMTLLGAVLVVWNPAGMTISGGLLWVVVSSFTGALAAVMMKQVKGVSAIRYQAWIGFASFWPLAAISAGFEPGQLHAAAAAGWPFLACVAYSAIVVSLGAHSIYYVMISRYDANLIAPLTLLNPIAAIAMSVAFMGEPLTLRLAFGGLLAMAGVLLVLARLGPAAPALPQAQGEGSASRA